MRHVVWNGSMAPSLPERGLQERTGRRHGMDPVETCTLHTVLHVKKIVASFVYPNQKTPETTSKGMSHHQSSPPTTRIRSKTNNSSARPLSRASFVAYDKPPTAKEETKGRVRLTGGRSGVSWGILHRTLRRRGNCEPTVKKVCCPDYFDQETLIRPPASGRLLPTGWPPHAPTASLEK